MNRRRTLNQGLEDLRARVLTIEADLDAAQYQPGSWDRLLCLARSRPQAERLALSADISRVSAKLHHRGGLRTLSVRAGVGLELLATALGAVMLAVALRVGSNVAALATAAIWMTTFEPLIKLLIGHLLGVRYEYGYVRGVEPRFKMRYGTYLAAPRALRIVLHLSGMIGSPLALWVVGELTYRVLPPARVMCTVAMWVLIALNVSLLVGALVGVRRIGATRLAISSGGAAARELREALGTRAPWGQRSFLRSWPVPVDDRQNDDGKRG